MSATNILKHKNSNDVNYNILKPKYSTAVSYKHIKT